MRGMPRHGIGVTLLLLDVRCDAAGSFDCGRFVSDFVPRQSRTTRSHWSSSHLQSPQRRYSHLHSLSRSSGWRDLGWTSSHSYLYLFLPNSHST